MLNDICMMSRDLNVHKTTFPQITPVLCTDKVTLTNIPYSDILYLVSKDPKTFPVSWFDEPPDENSTPDLVFVLQSNFRSPKW